jgi:hypothetical protein
VADRVDAVTAVVKAILKGLVVQTKFFSVDMEKVVHWTDVGGEILIQDYDTFDLAVFFVDMVGSKYPKIALRAARKSLSGTAIHFKRPAILHHSDPHELFEDLIAPDLPTVERSSSEPPTLRSNPNTEL